MFVSVKTSFQLFARGMDHRSRASDNESSVPSPTCPYERPATSEAVTCALSVAHYINKELNKISGWLKVNKLSLNAKKSKFMIFKHVNKTVIIKNRKY